MNKSKILEISYIETLISDMSSKHPLERFQTLVSSSDLVSFCHTYLLILNRGNHIIINFIKKSLRDSTYVCKNANIQILLTNYVQAIFTSKNKLIFSLHLYLSFLD